MSHTELKSFGPTGMVNSNNELMYRINVGLDQQTIDVYGKAQRPQVGMALEADILLETRSLYEWSLAPFFALSRKMPS